MLILRYNRLLAKRSSRSADTASAPSDNAKTLIKAGFRGDPYMRNPGAVLFPEAKNKPSVMGTEYIELWVGNAKQAAQYYHKCLGFDIVAYKGLETGSKDVASYGLSQGKVNIILTSTLHSGEEKRDESKAARSETANIGAEMNIGAKMNMFLTKHGDGVKNVALAVPDAKKALQETINSGAMEDESLSFTSPSGSVRTTAIKTFSDVSHVFIERDRDSSKSVFECLPGFEMLPRSAQSMKNSKQNSVGLQYIDHMVFNVGWNQMDTWSDYYRKIFGMQQLISFDDKDISTEYTALKSRVMTIDTGLVKYPINEPAKGLKQSQIEEYLNFNEGPGVQHVAFATNDIVKTVSALKERGVEFLRVPDSYYSSLKSRVGKVTEDVRQLKKLGILVDRDDKGYLLQIFTKPLTDRPTLFFEIIQRRGGYSFGKGNFKALFVSIEEEQRKRNTL